MKVGRDGVTISFAPSPNAGRAYRREGGGGGGGGGNGE